MTTTPSTASQAPAVSTFDNDEFWDLVIAYCKGVGHEGKSLVEYCDAKLAQAAEALRGQNELLRLELDDVRAALARERTSQTAAEAKLEAIRQGVEGLEGYDKNRVLVVYDDVLALLQPQHQADESGLPG